MPERLDFDHDCVIAGGGLVGASLACALAANGLRVALIEAVPLPSDSQPSYDDRGLALALSSQRVLQGLGVWDEVAAEATPMMRVHVSDRGHFGFTRLDAESAGLPALGYVVVARRLGQALAPRINSLNLLEFICPARVEAVDASEDAATVKIKLASGEERSLRAPLVVAADGGDSGLRDQLGIPAKRHDYHQTAVVANATPERHHEFTAYERFTDSGPLALLPLPEQRCAVVWVVRTPDAGELLELGDEAFCARLTERIGGRLGKILNVGRRRSYPLKLVDAGHCTAPRCVIMGNAAHTMHPNGAQGLNLGLREVAALAEVVLDAHRAGEDIGAAAVLNQYVDWRASDHRKVVRFSDGLTQIFYNDFGPLVVARNMAMLAVDLLPGLKRNLARRATGLSGHQPRLVRGLAL